MKKYVEVSIFPKYLTYYVTHLILTNLISDMVSGSKVLFLPITYLENTSWRFVVKIFVFELESKSLDNKI